MEHAKIGQDIKEVLESYVGGQQMDPVSIIGPYGSGKTQLLFHIFEHSWAKGIPALFVEHARTILREFEESTEEHISEERTKNKRTVKIINDFYRKKGDAFVFPGKPALGEISAKKMVNSKCIPEELNGIIKKLMSL